MLRVHAGSLGEYLDASDLASGRAQGFVPEQAFDLALLLRGKLAAFRREELDAVVGVGVVRGAYHGSGRGPETGREVRDTGRRQNAEVDNIGSAARGSGGEGAGEHLPGEARVAPDGDPAPESPGGGETEAQGVLRQQTLVGDTAHPVGAESYSSPNQFFSTLAPSERKRALPVYGRARWSSVVRASTPLTLGELRALAGLLEAVLLAFDGPGITSEQSRGFQLAAGLLRLLGEGARYAVAQGLGLPGRASAFDLGDDLVAACGAQEFQRRAHRRAVGRAGKVLVQLTAVHGDGAVSR